MNLHTDEKIITYRGRPVAEMEKLELLEVIEHLFQTIEDERERHQQTLDMWKLCRDRR